MQRIEVWPHPADFKINQVIWFKPSTEIIDWLDSAPGQRYQLELVNNNSTIAAASFESKDDTLLFCLTWDLNW